MSNIPDPKFFEMVPMLSGKPLKDTLKDNIYNLISAEEATIKYLESIENKPKSLVADIASRREAIKSPLDYMDAQHPSA